MKKYTQLVIIRYPASGETIAYRKDDPDLIDTLIDLCNIEYDDTVIRAELEEVVVIKPARTEERAFIQSEENPRVPYRIENGAQLRLLRKFYNLKQSDITSILGVTLTTFSRWENQYHKINKKHLPTLNDFFNNLHKQRQENKNHGA